MLNILMLAQNYGILLNAVDDQTLDQWKEVYQKTSITKTEDNDNCWGIDKKCYAYNWFIKKVMPVIAKTFKEEETQLNEQSRNFRTMVDAVNAAAIAIFFM